MAPLAAGARLRGTRQEAASDEESPPQVPERQSSQAGRQSRLQRSRARDLAAAAAAAAATEATAPGCKVSAGFDLSQLPRPLLSEHEWRQPRAARLAPLPPPRQQSGRPTLGSRPSQPPPPPPPPPPPFVSRPKSSESARQARRKSRAPKNIWSPSTSSAASSSCEESQNVDKERELRSESEQLGGAQAPKLAAGDLSSAHSMSPQDTVVERQQPHMAAREADRETGLAVDESRAKGAELPLAGVEQAQIPELMAQVQFEPGERMEQTGGGSAEAAATNGVEPEVASPSSIRQAQHQQTLATNPAGEQAAELSERPASRADEWDDESELVVKAPAQGDKREPLPVDQSGQVSGMRRAPPNEQQQQQPWRADSCWRSFSVSLQPADLALASGASAGQASHRADVSSRSYSIATSTLGCPGEAIGVGRGREEEEEEGGLLGCARQTKYWTLPGHLLCGQEGQVTGAMGSPGPLGAATGGSSAGLVGETQGRSEDTSSHKLEGSSGGRQLRDKLPASQRQGRRRTGESVAPANGYSSVVKRDQLEQAQAAFASSLNKQGDGGTADFGNTRDCCRAREFDQNQVNLCLYANEQQSAQICNRSQLFLYERTAEGERRQRLESSVAQQEMGQTRQRQQPLSGQPNGRDEWFKHMYKQMHKPSPEKSLLQAVNSQPDTGQIRIKLKSPKNG